MALNALTLSVTAGIQGRAFKSAVFGTTSGTIIEVTDAATQGFGYSNGFVYHNGLPADLNVVELRERVQATGESRISRVLVTSVTEYAVKAQALTSTPMMRGYRVAGVAQSDGSLAYSVFVEDQTGATTASPVGTAVPTLTLTGPLNYATNAAAGTLVANIGNVPAGVTPTVTPNDGRLVVAGSAGAWTVVAGMTASTAGTISLAVAATGATGASATVTVTAAPAYAMPKLAAAITAMKAGNGRAILMGIGDSIMAGWGTKNAVGQGQYGANAGDSTSGYTPLNAWLNQMAPLFVNAGIPCRADAFFGDANMSNQQIYGAASNYTSANPNITFTSDWVLATETTRTSVGGSWFLSSGGSAGAAVFTPQVAANRLDIFVYMNAGGTGLTVSDQSGVLATIPTDAGSGNLDTLKRVTVSRAVSSTQPFSIVRTTTAKEGGFIGLAPWDSNSPTLEIWNGGIGGAQVSTWLQSSPSPGLNPAGALSQFPAHGFIVALGANDQAQGVSDANYQSQLGQLVDLLAAIGTGDVLLAKEHQDINSTGQFYQSPGKYAAVDTVSTAKGLSAPLNLYTGPAYITTDYWDEIHFSAQGDAREAAFAVPVIRGKVGR